MTKIFDVVVVGAGPAGSTAAYYTRNLKVLIIDKFTFPRDKACGGGLINSRDWAKEFENYSKIEKNLTKCPTDSIKIYWRYKKLVEKEGEHFWDQINRKEFDNLLLQEALKKKNVIYKKFELKSIEEKESNYILSNGKDKIQTKYIIGADGWDSIVSIFLGNEKRDSMKYGLCLEYDVRCNKKDTSSHIFYNYQNELGYSWVLPTISGYYIGLGFVGETKKPLVKYLNDFLTDCIKLGIVPKEYKIKSTFGAPDPIQLQKKFCSDRIILCGDAMGTVHQPTGEGIYFAMKSGKIAGETISNFKGDLKKNYIDLTRGLRKDITVLKKIPGKKMSLLIFRSFFRIIVYFPIPRFMRKKLYDKLVNKIARRNNLPKGSFYQKFK